MIVNRKQEDGEIKIEVQDLMRANINFMRNRMILMKVMMKKGRKRRLRIINWNNYNINSKMNSLINRDSI